jgi:hypothetical protein
MAEKEEGSGAGETMAGNLKEKPADAESFDGQEYAGGGAGADAGTGGGYAGGTNVSSQGGGSGSSKQGGNTGGSKDASG